MLGLLLSACGEKVGMRGVAYSATRGKSPFTRNAIALRPLPRKRGEVQ
jgi:hypothetical protein